MKLIIAGSRHFIPTTVYTDISNVIIYAPYVIDEIVSGTARGVDTAGEMYAKANRIMLTRFKPDYEKYSHWIAPRRRNYQMAEYGDILLLIWDGKSKGSKHMKEMMTERRKIIWERILK